MLCCGSITLFKNLVHMPWCTIHVYVSQSVSWKFCWIGQWHGKLHLPDLLLCQTTGGESCYLYMGIRESLSAIQFRVLCMKVSKQSNILCCHTALISWITVLWVIYRTVMHSKQNSYTLNTGQLCALWTMIEFCVGMIKGKKCALTVIKHTVQVNSALLTTKSSQLKHTSVNNKKHFWFMCSSAG